MALFLYIMLLLSCTHTVLQAASESKERSYRVKRAAPESLQRYRDERASKELRSYRAQMVERASVKQTLLPPIHVVGQITNLQAAACYHYYTPGVRSRRQSQRGLNVQLQEILDQPIDSTGLFRVKIVALLFAGAQNEKINRDDRLLRYVVTNDDLPLTDYALRNNHIKVNDDGISYPAIWDCKSVAMARLLLEHGEDLRRKDYNQRNILHHLCYNGDEAFSNLDLVRFYHANFPSLLEERDAQGKTPLLYAFERPTPLLLYAYAFLSLGAKPYLEFPSGEHQGKTPYELLMKLTNSTIDPKQKDAIGELARYIQNLPCYFYSPKAIAERSALSD